MTLTMKTYVVQYMYRKHDNMVKVEYKHSSRNKEDGDRWIREIQDYIDIDDEYVVKLALGYLLQSLRNGEDINRFKWRDETCGH